MTCRTLFSVLLVLAFSGLVTAAPPPTVRLLASNQRPYVGEPLTLTLEINHSGLPHQATTLIWPQSHQVARSDQPQFELRPSRSQPGLWVETARLQLTPLQPGTLRLTGGGLLHEGAVIPAAALQLRVRPLPRHGQPDNFSGLVGDMNGELTLVATDSATPTLQLELTGTAALQALQMPEPELAPGVELLKLSDQSRQLDATHQQRTLRYLYQQRWPGLNKVRFTFNLFNPETGNYETRVVATGRATSGVILTILTIICGIAGPGALFRAWRRRPRTIEGLLTRLLNKPVGGLPRDEILKQLEAGHPELTVHLRRYWAQHDGRFAPGGKQPVGSSRGDDLELRRRLRKAIDKSGRLPALSGLVTSSKGPS